MSKNKKLSLECQKWITLITSQDYWSAEALTQSMIEELTSFQPKGLLILYRAIRITKGESVFNMGFSEGQWPRQNQVLNYSPPNMTHWTKDLNFATQWGAQDDHYFILETNVSPKDVIIDTTLIDDKYRHLLSFDKVEQDVIIKPGDYESRVVLTFPFNAFNK